MRGGSARAAAQALQHVWITDDVLTQAFHRFVRVSQVHRRHGSNVPGPLEARRRQARRKIGMEAVARTSMPPADFGSLFGLGSARPPPDFEKGWRWEAPLQVASGAATTEQRTDLNPFDVDSHQLPPTTTTSKGHAENKPQDYHQSKAFEDFFSIPADPTETSISAFKALLQPIKKEKHLDLSHIRPLAVFLDSAANEPDAQLTLRLVQWLTDRTVASDAVWRVIAQSIKSRARNSDINLDEVTSIFMHLLYHQEKGHELLPFLARLPMSAREVYAKLTERVLQTSHDKNERIAKIGIWLNRVHPPHHLGQPHGPWLQVYEQLAQHFQPSDFAEHFGGMPRNRFAWALLQHWAPTYAQLEISPVTTGMTEGSGSDQGKFGSTVVPQGGHKSYAAFDEFTATFDWKSVREQFHKRDRNGSSFILNTLIILLKQNRIPYDRLQAEIFAVYMATQPAPVTKNLVLSLISRREGQNPGITSELATELVHHFLATGHTSYALYVFLSVPGIPLQNCYDLPLKLIEEGRTHGAKIMQILLRAAPGETVPPSSRTHPRNDITAKHIRVVHKAAYAWACSPHINARTAFRRVWECYRFLRDRRAPVYPLMSRAMVKAGLSRAIKQNGRLSREQARYVIGLVEGIEGRATAVELDRLVYEYWTRVKDVQRYRPGVQEDQEGKYWPLNRWIWKADASKKVPPPGVRRKESRTDMASFGAQDSAIPMSPASTEMDSAVAELSAFLNDEIAGLLDAKPHQTETVDHDPTTFMPFGASTEAPAEAPAPAVPEPPVPTAAPLDLKTTPLVRASESPLRERQRQEAAQHRSRASSETRAGTKDELRYWRPETVRQEWLRERGSVWESFQQQWRHKDWRGGEEGTISRVVVDRREEPLMRRLEGFCGGVEGGERREG